MHHRVENVAIDARQQVGAIIRSERPISALLITIGNEPARIETGQHATCADEIVGIAIIIDVDAAFAIRIEIAHILERDIVRNAIAGRAIIATLIFRIIRIEIEADLVRSAQPRALMRAEPVFLAMLIGEGDIAPAIAEVQTTRDRDQALTRIAIARGAGLHPRAKPLEIVLHHEIDDARNGIRTVNGRLTARQHIDPLDQIAWNGIDVDRALAGHAANMAAAIDEHERALRPQIAQIKQVLAGRADAATITRIIRRER